MLKNHASCNTTNSTLETLVLETLGCTFEAHDALEDCTYLQKLVEHHSTDSYYLNYTFSMDYMMQVVLQMEDSKSNLQTLMSLLTNKTVPESMVNRMSLSGLSMHHLQLNVPKRRLWWCTEWMFSWKTKSNKAQEHYYICRWLFERKITLSHTWCKDIFVYFHDYNTGYSTFLFIYFTSTYLLNVFMCSSQV